MSTDLLSWQASSFYAFLLRHRDVFRAEQRALSKERRASHDVFFRYAIELDVLELDLKLTLDELRMAYEVLYGEARHLARKKFAVVYHVDNFYIRVHKLLENVYGLVALMVGLDPDTRTAPGSPSRRAGLRNALAKWRLTAIDARLRQFEEEKVIQEARAARNLFVHRYREEPKWPALAPMSRLLEFEDTDETERLIRRELEPPEIDRYADRKAEEFHQIIERIGDLRAGFCRIALREAVAVVSREPSEVRRRWQWLADHEALIQELGG